MTVKSFQRRLRQLGKANDQFRASIQPDAVSLSPALKSLPPALILEIIEQVRQFRNFHPRDKAFDEHKLGFF